MSKMGDMMIDIEERLVDGQDPATVAKKLGVPLDWVIGTMDEMINGPRAYGPDYDYCDDGA